MKTSFCIDNYLGKQCSADKSAVTGGRFSQFAISGMVDSLHHFISAAHFALVYDSAGFFVFICCHLLSNTYKDKVAARVLIASRPSLVAHSLIMEFKTVLGFVLNCTQRVLELFS